MGNDIPYKTVDMQKRQVHERNQAAGGGSMQVQNIILFGGLSKDRSKEMESPQGAALVCLSFSHFIIYLQFPPLGLL